jgi:hypothetical protein
MRLGLEVWTDKLSLSSAEAAKARKYPMVMNLLINERGGDCTPRMVCVQLGVVAFALLYWSEEDFLPHE